MESSRVYELTPNGKQKSFYGKACVHVNDGTETLYSYGTKIMVRNFNGEFSRCWRGWTATTGRHIKAFSGLNKAGYEALPMESR